MGTGRTHRERTAPNMPSTCCTGWYSECWLRVAVNHCGPQSVDVRSRLLPAICRPSTAGRTQPVRSAVSYINCHDHYTSSHALSEPIRTHCGPQSTTATRSQQLLSGNCSQHVLLLRPALTQCGPQSASIDTSPVATAPVASSIHCGPQSTTAVRSQTYFILLWSLYCVHYVFESHSNTYPFLSIIMSHIII